MAIKNFGVKEYASLEINRAAFLKNGLIVSQTPLAATFTAANPCENGMWLNADISNGVVDVPKANDTNSIIAICYTTEKEYGYQNHQGLKHFCAVAGEYPRMGILHNGDHFTTNCFSYDDATYSTETALLNALKGNTKFYLKPGATNGRPVLTTSKPSTGVYAEVIGLTTMPDGETAIKYVVRA